MGQRTGKQTLLKLQYPGEPSPRSSRLGLGPDTGKPFKLQHFYPGMLAAGFSKQHWARISKPSWQGFARLREQREGSWLTSPRPSPSPRPAGAERREGTSIGPNRWKHKKTRTEKKETNFLSTSKTVSVVPQRGTCNNKFKSHRPLSKEAIKRQIINGKQAHFRHNSIWAAHRLSKRRSSLFPTLSGFLLLLFLLFISSVGQKWNKLPFWYEPCTSQVQKHEAKLGGLQPFPIRSMGLGLMARGWNVVWDTGQHLELSCPQALLLNSRNVACLSASLPFLGSESLFSTGGTKALAQISAIAKENKIGLSLKYRESLIRKTLSSIPPENTQWHRAVLKHLKEQTPWQTEIQNKKSLLRRWFFTKLWAAWTVTLNERANSASTGAPTLQCQHKF